MKLVSMTLLFTALSLTAHAQKTTRLPISESKGLTVSASITEADTLFMMLGQNQKYKHIVSTIAVKHGKLEDISDLLNECMKFLPEKEDTSLEYKGNTILSMGGNRLMVFGTGRDSGGYVLLDRKSISKLQTDIATFKK